MTTSTTDAEAIARIIDPDVWHKSLPRDGRAVYWDTRRKKARNKAAAILSYLASRREAQEPVGYIRRNTLDRLRGGNSGPIVAVAGFDTTIPLFTASPSPIPVPAPAGEPPTITYTNYRGETAQRTILPKSIWFGSTEWHPEPQWFLRAVDVEKNAERDFALKDFGTAPAGGLVARLKRLEIEAADLNYKLVPEPVPQRGPDAPAPAPAGEIERLLAALRIARGYVEDDAKREPSGYDPHEDLKRIDAALNGGRSE